MSGPPPLRVFYLIDKLHRAGAQVHLDQLTKGLDRDRFAVEVGCLLRGGPVAEAMRGRGLSVEELGVSRIYGVRALARLPRLVRRLRGVDVLHTYLVSSNLYGTLAGRLAGVPSIVTTRRDTGFSRNARLRFLEERFVNPRVTKVVAVSPAVAEVTRRERGLRESQVVTIPNGVDIESWDPARFSREELRREWGVPSSVKVIGAVGSLTPVKGHADLLQATARLVVHHPDLRLFLIGEGPLRSSLSAQARDLGLGERVVFTGARSDVPRLLALLDVAALPSHTEGMSNTLLEAMAMARPVVASAVGGNVDLLRDGITGRLVPPRDPEALAQALRSLLENTEAACAMGARARRGVAAEYSLARMVARHEELYRSVTASGEPR